MSQRSDWIADNDSAAVENFFRGGFGPGG